MKKPLISDIDRWSAQKVPNSNFTKRIEFTIAFTRLKREIGRVIKKILVPGP